MTFISGAILGLSLATVFGLGPAFFTLIQTSINKGFKRALFLDAGILLSDIAVVVLIMMTSIQLDFSNGNKNILIAGIAAGLIIIVFGISTYRTKPERVIERSKRQNKDFENYEKKFEKLDQKLDKIDEKFYIKKVEGSRWYVFMSKGFLMNIFNPFIWFFWFGCVTTASSKYDGDTKLLMTFFIGTFATVLFFDIMKIVGAYSLKSFFTEERMKIFNHIIGIILIICGLIVITKVLIM